MNTDFIELLFDPVKKIKNFYYPPKRYEMDLKYDDYDKLRAEFISNFWIDKWYDEKLPTPKTSLILVENNDLNNFDQERKLNDKFVRLNSVSTKKNIKHTLLSDCVKEMAQSSRCLNSVDIANFIDDQIYICIRDWIDIDSGFEFRCFIFNDKLKAICSNDDKICSYSDSHIIDKCVSLFDKVKYNLPVPDCIMDVFLSDSDDLLIEFNSYGFIGNSDAGLFDWHSDATILFGTLANDIVIRRIKPEF